MFKKSLLFAALGCVAVSQATITQVATRAALAENDRIDWGQYSNTGLVPSGSYGLTNAGVTFQVADQDASDMFEFVTSGVAGIAPFWGLGGGHNALYTTSNNGPIYVKYAASQMAVGTDLMVNFFGTYQVRMDAYNNLDQYLGSVSAECVSSPDLLGNAPFLGLESTESDIAFVAIKVVTDFQTGGFAIDEVSSRNCAVPEPASMAMLGLGFMGLVVRRRNKR